MTSELQLKYEMVVDRAWVLFDITEIVTRDRQDWVALAEQWARLASVYDCGLCEMRSLLQELNRNKGVLFFRRDDALEDSVRIAIRHLEVLSSLALGLREQYLRCATESRES